MSCRRRSPLHCGGAVSLQPRCTATTAERESISADESAIKEDNGGRRTARGQAASSGGRGLAQQLANDRFECVEGQRPGIGRVICLVRPTDGMALVVQQDGDTGLAQEPHTGPVRRAGPS